MIDAARDQVLTGGPSERLQPGWSPLDTFVAHIHRYYFAAELARDKNRILDLGSEIVYNSSILDVFRKLGEVITPEILAWAKGLYRSVDRDIVHASMETFVHNQSKTSSGACDTKDPEGYYELVTAFETMEHITDHAALLDLAAKRMAETGAFIVSVPNPELHGTAVNLHHKRSFTADHFRLILKDRFQEVSFFYQNREHHDCLAERYCVQEGLPADAEFWLAVCRRPKLRRKRPRASIVIPLFNKFSYTLKALISISKNTPDDILYEVILVDNASTDETPRSLKKLGGNVVVLRNNENLGFAKASNQGALLALGEYVIFLNNDTEVHPGWIQALIDELDANPNTGIVGGRLIYPDGTIQHAGVAIGRDMIPIHIHSRLPSNDPKVTERRSYPIVTAACAAVRREEFYSIGMFDEKFINGHEDIDLCFRYKKRGMEVIYQPKCLITHHESVSEGRMAFRLQNLKRTMHKWRYELVQDDFRYCCTEASRGKPARSLRFALKIGPPDRFHTKWGDVYFAESLARALVHLGHECRIDYLNEWGRDDLDIDVVIHLKGLSEYHPKPYNLNVLWMLNHPSLHTTEELGRYDAVLVASGLYAKQLKNNLSVPVYEFLQSTDTRHFLPKPEKKRFDLIFVGNNKGVDRLNMRQIIADLLPTKHSLAVWGNGWEGLLPEGIWQGQFVPWEELPAVYAQGRIVLNDHQPEMREYGFINNRTYDAIASGVFVISDHVNGMKDVLPIPSYLAPTDLQRIIKKLLNGGAEEERKFARLRNKVLASFTFDKRAEELLDIIKTTWVGDVTRRIESARKKAHDYRTSDGPLISVLMSTHNRREFLPTAIASIRAQTYPNWELVLVRDGGEQVADLISRINDSRIRLIELEERRGKGHAINRAFLESRGEFIAYLDDDDIFYPEHLDKLLFFLINIPTIGMAITNTEKITLEENGQGLFHEIKRELIYHRQITAGELLDKNQITWLSVMHKRELFEQVGGLDERLSALIDHDLWRRMTVQAYPYHVTATTAEYYTRKYPAISGKGQITQMAESDPPRYLANRVRIMAKRLQLPPKSPLWQAWYRLKRESRHEFLIARARKFKDSGMMNRCRATYRLAVRIGHDPSAAWRELGLAEFEAGNPVNALIEFQRCVNAPNNQREADFLYAALISLELCRPTEALDYLTRLEAKFPINKRVMDIVNDYRARAKILLTRDTAIF